MKKIIPFLLLVCHTVFSQNVSQERNLEQILSSQEVHGGSFSWTMKKAGELSEGAEKISTSAFTENGWLPAVVPGTVLRSLVYNGVYPEPYWGLNNKLESGLIPDLYYAGRDFYTYWFRTSFDLPQDVYEGRKIWLQVDGINYRAEIWLNGSMVGNIAGMFVQDKIDITDYTRFDEKNVLAVKVYPVDFPGTVMPKEGKASI
jgi:hypothetical protein